MKIYSYVVTHDTNLAPHIADGYCSLAVCKPKIRKVSIVGDWIVGTGSSKTVGCNKIVYAMKTKEKLTFSEYDADERFRHREDKLVNRYHNSTQRKHDLGGKYVLISDDYYYFKQKRLPKKLHWIIKIGRAHRCNFDEDKKTQFVNWIRTQKRGPLNFRDFDRRPSSC